MKHTQLNISFRVGMSVYIAESWSVKYLIIHLYPFTSFWTYLILNMTTRFTLFDELNTCCGVILWWQSYVLIVSVKLWALFSEQCVMVVIYVNDASRVEQFLYRIIQACPAQICASYTVSVIQTILYSLILFWKPAYTLRFSSPVLQVKELWKFRWGYMYSNALRTIITYLLVHIDEKKTITSVNGT